MKHKLITAVFSIIGATTAMAEQTMEEYRSWCYGGQGLACTRAANKEVENKRFKSARVLFEKGCKMGEDQACIGLATLDIKDGKTQKARNHLERSCGNKVSFACVKLAELEMNAGNKKKAEQILAKDCHDNAAKEACAVLDRMNP
jgi:hypothetical protein